MEKKRKDATKIYHQQEKTYHFNKENVMANPRIGSLWAGKQGSKALLTGAIDLLGEDIRIVVFKNDKKEEGSKQPDYHIVRSKDQNDGDGKAF
jgi:hypothetical protein